MHRQVYQERRQLRESFYDKIVEWQGERDKRQDFVKWDPMNWGSGPVCEWHKWEMERLLEEINLQRQRRSKEPITIQELKRTELSASGHFDYTSKLALYSMEMTLDG